MGRSGGVFYFAGPGHSWPGLLRPATCVELSAVDWSYRKAYARDRRASKWVVIQLKKLPAARIGYKPEAQARECVLTLACAAGWYYIRQTVSPPPSGIGGREFVWLKLDPSNMLAI